MRTFYVLLLFLGICGLPVGALQLAKRAMAPVVAPAISPIFERQPLEEAKPVLDAKNARLFQGPFIALQSHGGYDGFEWPGFYEITNLSKKPVTLTGFRVTWAPASFEGKHLRLVLRTNPSEVVLFNDENAVIDSVEGKAKDPSTTKFPVTIPPHATYFLRIHCIFDLLSGEKPLKFQDENDAHKWIAGAVGLPPGANGKVRCVSNAHVPVEISTADGRTLKYEPETVLFVPGCVINVPPGLKKP